MPNKTLVVAGLATAAFLPAIAVLVVVFLFASVVEAIGGGMGEVEVCKPPDDGEPLPPGNSGGTVEPTKNYKITDTFGTLRTREDGSTYRHGGLDLAAPGGTPVYAFADGKATVKSDPGGYGDYVEIVHNFDGERVETLYAHMYRDQIPINTGDKVKAGQGIGRVGTNGNSSGNHLHFEMRIDGRLVDPQPHVEDARKPGTPPPDDGNGNDEGNDEEQDGMDGFKLPKPDGPGKHGGKVGPIPDNYLAAYKAAGDKYKIPWQWLAGHGWIETKHGTLDAPGVDEGQNSAGAMGPMQFLQGTWDQYGVDGNDDGEKNVYDIADAAFGAANYLVASGGHDGPEGVRDAIYAYNRANWYVNDVLNYAWQYAEGKVPTVPGDDSGQCDPNDSSRNGGDTSPGTHGADPDELKLNWPDEQATIPDPTTSEGHITPRMKKLYDVVADGKGPSEPSSIGCWRPQVEGQDPDFSEHPDGQACDFMYTPTNTKKNVDAGWAMANWLVDNQRAFGVDYIIWQGKIWSASNQPDRWRTYTEGGCPNEKMVTYCHYDHVHVSVY